MSETPDSVITHRVGRCEDCRKDLSESPVDKVERLQEFDIPESKPVVTEHQSEVKVCPHCGHVNKAEFPEGINNVVQYGLRTQALALYLYYRQFLPYERIHEVFSEVFGMIFSPGSLEKVAAQAYASLSAFEGQVKDFLCNASLLHLDETCLRCCNKLYWMNTETN